ncbi:hypothetical protein [Culturomica massiliensis]|uniref:hypothetical protein n=1 Tax=Culturomica massiliensis TaxID=1841857 RepID=UPI002670A81F|nr:hypothetical protein [Culturomica massiliensis]
MKREIITISETGTVTVPDVPVWMTLPEIADMLGVFEYDVRKTIKSIYRNKELRKVFDRQIPQSVSFSVQVTPTAYCQRVLINAIPKKWLFDHFSGIAFTLAANLAYLFRVSSGKITAIESHLNSEF